MPYYATSQEWLHQSSLLIEARPTTTRITTKYHISKPKPRRIKKTDQPTSSSTSAVAAPRGSLTLKTYDPHSGACLKYRTTKAAEVSRLILSLGQPLGARMAALPLGEAADEVMVDAGAAVEEKGEVATAAATTTPAGGKGEGKSDGKQGGSGGGGGGGGKGKKKKGKK
ncbi:signal recognition particle 9 kDa protein-domain-containing protein [Annulohypoxylon maeteangense]|uniref:signal recognition particle 9 kDa protein-domain-containing protein n=1 Tax=Annulohypoxylon maeteangense TaxID=1927788 RepID=UPI00200727E1|nr:signal recognition particle 9 kDa protein-domain-containing protein [Annulohypoxylon maeteangense]KAI0887362.1 signal recognition particle 9 kDa protein-domain-containing protein [Annulohypoxylon maeteangense]